MRNLDEADLPAPEPKLFQQAVGLKAPQSGCAALFPHAFKRAEARGSELPGGRGEVQTAVGVGLLGLAPAGATEPIELFDVCRRQPLDVGVTDREAMERDRVPESSRHENADRPFVHNPEQLCVPDEERTEVRGHPVGYQVRKEMAPVLMRHTNRKFVREVANRFLPTLPELELRIEQPPIVLEGVVEVGHLVPLRPKP